MCPGEGNAMVKTVRPGKVRGSAPTAAIVGDEELAMATYSGDSENEIEVGDRKRITGNTT